MSEIFVFFMGLFQKIRTFYRMFIAPPKVYRPPPETNVLIYDRVGSENIVPLLGGNEFSILSTRGEDVNIYVLISILCDYRLILGIGLRRAYIRKYILLSKAMTLITFIDNNPEFYFFSKELGIKTVIFQNGLRNRISAPFLFGAEEQSGQNFVDYMFLYGKAIAGAYNKVIGGEAIVVGSIKSNMVSLNRHTGNKLGDFSAIYISSWRPRSPIDGEPTYYGAEKYLLPLLSDWCREKGFTLKILTRFSGEDSRFKTEREFYQSIPGLDRVEFLRDRSSESPYDLIDTAKINVAIDSALGQESLSRGNRTAIIHIRHIFCSGTGVDTLAHEGFGWPCFFPQSGPFWTCSSSALKIRRLFHSVTSSNEKSWQSVINEYVIPEIMVFDPQNTIAKNHLGRIIGGGFDNLH
jgi:surface carbohydrate biosynthesis protein